MIKIWPLYWVGSTKSYNLYYIEQYIFYFQQCIQNYYSTYINTHSTVPPQSHTNSVLLSLPDHNENQDDHETYGNEGQSNYYLCRCIQGKLLLSKAILEVQGMGLEVDIFDPMVWEAAAKIIGHRFQTKSHVVVRPDNPFPVTPRFIAHVCHCLVKRVRTILVSHFL